MKRDRVFFPVMLVAIVLLVAANLLVGTVRIPAEEVWRILCGDEGIKQSWQYIVLESRVPQAVTAMLCGACLAVSGLMLQTAFRNPLAGPGIFGVNSGASLGVALVMLLMGGSVGVGSFTLTGFLATLFAAFMGAMLVLALILAASFMVRNHVMLLIVGIMIGYIASSAIALLNFFATEEGVQSYMVWGMGSFGGVSTAQLPWFVGVCTVALVAALLFIKPLNALLLGEQYATNLGFNVVQLRNLLLLVTGVLSAVATAFCGPVAFIGLAVPHVSRLLLGSDNHRPLIPLTMMTGAAVALLCNLICVLPGDAGIIPLNAVTPLIGAPVVIYIITRHKGA